MQLHVRVYTVFYIIVKLNKPKLNIDKQLIVVFRIMNMSNIDLFIC